MPLCNIRSIIEILLPGDLGSGLADAILWPVPFWEVPLLYVLPFIYGAFWLARRNFKMFLWIAIPLFILNQWTQANSKYSYHPLPYLVKDEQKSEEERQWNAENPHEPHFTYHPGYAWVNDDSRMDGDLRGFYFQYQTTAIPGKVTQEEANYQHWLNNESLSLITNGVMSAADDSALAPTMRDYLVDREQTEQGLMPLHYGSFHDRIKYRWAIDTMNAKPSPLQPYIDRRVKENADVSFRLWGPVVLGFIILAALAFVIKYTIKAKEFVGTKVSTVRWDDLLAGFNRARVIKKGLEIDGPIFLRYPKLFINDAPFDLEYADFDEEHKNVVHLKDGTRLYLYYGDVAPAYVQAPPPKRPKFTWDYIDPNKIKEPPGVISTNRRSIFSER